ncbi:hypothetical protein [Mucilaginibacter sp.]|uniref:hypothetical protein n=1 Tax=Mucilaginibacter sp. TaxID=1882438 RepID=UPI00284603AE|nr:hypothetical protein [Mucilaginibacter sp.]MDR3694765.1 hypothetical protein [Mucilaginibacter sp.]
MTTVSITFLLYNLPVRLDSIGNRLCKQLCHHIYFPVGSDQPTSYSPNSKPQYN